MQMWGKRIKRIWAVTRHILSIHGLLQWIGVWPMISTLAVSAIATWMSKLKNVPGPYLYLIGLGTFVFVFIGWRVWQISKNIEIELPLPRTKSASEIAYNRPDVTLECTQDSDNIGAFRFELHNGSDYAAVDITASDIMIPIPDWLLKQWQEQSTPEEIAELPSHWIVKFSEVSRLIKGVPAYLPYRIENMGAMQRRDLKYALKALQSPQAKVEFVLQHSDTNDPKMTWQTHYALIYQSDSDTLIARHLTTKPKSPAE
jgi:hypothetical protein